MSRLEDKHATGPYLITLARVRISLKILGEGLLELKGDAASHHTHTIDGVNDRFRRFSQNAACLILYHRGPTFIYSTNQA